MTRLGSKDVEPAASQPGVSFGSFADGTTRLERRWAVEEPKATLLVVHGIGEHSGRYANVGAALAQVDIDVMAFDNRGFGQSGGRRAFVTSFDQFVDDVVEMLEERQTQIAEGLAAADKGNRALEEAEVEKTSILDEARGQAREIIDQANNRGSSIVDEARTEAGSEKDRILASAQSEVEQEANRAREELRSQVGAIAVSGAEKILQREIDANAHKDLLDKLAAEI